MANALRSIPCTNPYFVIGVTGNRDPYDPDALRKHLRKLFQFVKYGRKGHPYFGGKKAAKQVIKDLRDMLPDFSQVLSEADQYSQKSSIEVYDRFFDSWPGLGNTPLMVMSSLAKGADQLVAEVGLEFGARMVYPLAFPPDLLTGTNDPLWAVHHARIEEFRDFLQPPTGERFECGRQEEWFVVAMKEEYDYSRARRYEQYRNDIVDNNRRHLRYQAAGEYIAAYSHLLIAIWDELDDTDSAEGTASIVEKRRSGLTPGLLPTASALLQPSDGPTYHIHIRREKRKLKEGRGIAKRKQEPDWSARWLFPRSPELLGNGPTDIDDLNVEWQAKGLAQFASTVDLLQHFVLNAKQPELEKLDNHLEEFLSYDGSEVSIVDKVKATSPRLFEAIRRVAGLRRRSTNQQYEEKRIRDYILGFLFLFALLAAGLTHTFNHWHAQFHEGHHKAPPSHQETSVSEANGISPILDKHQDAPKEGEPAVHDQKVVEARLLDELKELQAEELHADALTLRMDYWIRALMGAFGAFFGICALICFWWFRPLRYAEKSDDYRALSEALRVQMIWMIAGVGESVSANYLRRQRGELAWIRWVVRSVSIPYETARWSFMELSPDLQVEMLRCVAYNWLKGRPSNAQANYFATSRKKEETRLHFWHTIGKILVLAGLAVSLFFVVATLGLAIGATWTGGDAAGTRWDLFHFVEQWKSWLLIPAGLFLITVIGMITKTLCHASSDKCNWDVIRDHVCHHWFHRMIPPIKTQLTSNNRWIYFWMMAGNFLFYLIWTLLIAIATVTLAAWLPTWHELLPGLQAWLIILSAILLLLGSLSIVWPERNLCSELRYQYGTMQSVFELAANQIIPQIDALEQAPDEQEFAKRLRTIQEALFDLGKEALDENAEWLILHRARPMEPVLPG
ncbi:hypothetical protein GC197_06665 [bacterium]|nr:hypothetical protein [bacterium]